MAYFGDRESTGSNTYEPLYGTTNGSVSVNTMYSTLERPLHEGCKLFVYKENIFYEATKDIDDLTIQIYILISDGSLKLEDGCDPGSDDIWTDYYYYANEAEDRNSIMAWNHKTMKIDKEIKLVGINPHSVDRACLTDKMYCRTQNVNSFDVIDVRRGIWLKSVALPFFPRTCGDQNIKFHLQLVSGNSNPGIALIDTITDTVIFTDGYEKGDSGVVGNQGGSSTGHPAWFDERNFGYLDRVQGKVRMYRVYGEIGDFTIGHERSVQVSTAMHTIQDDKIDWAPGHSKFYGTIEGDKDRGITPAIQEFNYYGNDDLRVGRKITLPNSSPEDTIHHFSISPDGTELWIPTFFSKKTHVIDLKTMTVKKSYDSGLGGGHVYFSTHLARACVTNHFDSHISVLNMKTTYSWQVRVNNDKTVFPGPLLQSHSNYISDDGRFYFFANTHNGEMVKFDIKLRRVYSKIYVGGHPEQSIS